MKQVYAVPVNNQKQYSTTSLATWGEMTSHIYGRNTIAIL